MKNLKGNTFILLLITACVLYFVLKDDFGNIVSNLYKADIKLLLVGLLLTILYWFFKSLALYNITKNYKNIPRREIFKQVTITQFFHGVTPFASGGQPMQVYMLTKSGIKLTHSTNIIVQNFFLYQMALITHGVIAVSLNFFMNYIPANSFLRNLTILGFTINALVGLVLIFVSFSEKFNSFVVNNLITFFSKIKLVKKKDKSIKKWKAKISEFHESAVILRKNKGLIVKGYLYNMIGLLCYYLTPLFVIYALGINISPIIVYVCCAYVSIIGSFVPIPGGSGGIEYSFLQFFGYFITGSILPAILILWRSITYYFAILAGGILFTTFKGEVKE